MNRKTSKRALGLSFVSMLLCITMLMGTTFAWFTDNATVAVNTIQAGTIDIRIVDSFNGEDMEGKELKFVNKNGETDILWEPGATYFTQPVRVMNYSNLSFYMDAFISGFKGDLELLDAIEFKIVHAYACLPASQGGLGLSFDQCNGRSYVYAGTGTVFTGEGKNGDNLKADVYGIQADWTDQLNDYDNDGDLEAGPGVDEPKPLYDLCIIAKMKDEAGNQYQGKKLTGAALTFVATQSPYEYDSYDYLYDKDAEFPELGTVVTEGDIVVPKGETLMIGGGDVNDYKLIESSGDGVVIDNVDFVGTTVVWGAGGPITINGGTFKATAIVVKDSVTAPIVINGGTFDVGSIDASTGGDVTINGGTFTCDPSGFVAAGKTVVNNGDGTWTVK